MGKRAWRVLEWGCAGIALLLVIGVVWVGYTLYRLMNHMGVQHDIVHSGGVIVDAITHFENERGTRPGSLDDLTPDFLPEIPEVMHADRVTYLTDTQSDEWSLRVHTSELGPSQVYVFDSDEQLSPEDETRHVGSIHGWYILDPAEGPE